MCLLAQWLEHQCGLLEVAGSIPVRAIQSFLNLNNSQKNLMDMPNVWQFQLVRRRYYKLRSHIFLKHAQLENILAKFKIKTRTHLLLPVVLFSRQ